MRDMDAWAGAARLLAQGADAGAEPPAETVEAEAEPAAHGDPWQRWDWWQGGRGEPSADGVWNTQWWRREPRNSR